MDVIGFLKSGELGELKLGQSAADITSFLGDPDARIERGCDSSGREMCCWRYGICQLFFTGDHVTVYGLYWPFCGETMKLPTALEFSNFVLREDITVAEMRSFMDAHGVAYHEVGSGKHKGQLVTQGHVLLVPGRPGRKHLVSLVRGVSENE